MRYAFLLAASCIAAFATAQQPTNWTATTARSNKTADINPGLKPFYHGVASGDPLTDRVILWTRVTPDSLTAPVTVTWEIATDLEFNAVVNSGTFVTDNSRDFTVKVDADGLQPNTYYYYRFTTDTNGVAAQSLTGRTKTTPAGPTENLKVAAMSCSNYIDGYFTPYGNLAARNDLDLILHLGDYIYDYGIEGFDDRDHDPAGDPYTLADYRGRYAQYHTDPELLRLHQVHPFALILDDHDIIVDLASDTSLRHNNPAVTFTDRKQAAVQALREWLPVRDDSVEFFKLWRKLPFGDLLDVVVIDDRIYDRDTFVRSTSDPLYGDSSHHFLGPVQLAWFNEQLRNSTATWKLVGTSLQFSQFGLDFLGFLYYPIIYENWDGYPYERNQVFDNLENNAIDNVVFAAGDWHVGYAVDVARDPFPGPTQTYNPTTGDGSLAVEFVVPSVNTGNLDEGGIPGFGDLPIPVSVIESGLKAFAPHYQYANFTDNGYLLLNFSPEELIAEFWFANTIESPTDRSATRKFAARVQAGENHVEETTEYGTCKTAPTPPAPAPGYVPHPGTEFECKVDTVTTRPAVPPTDEPIVISLHPNPTTDRLSLSYVLPLATHLRLDVLDNTGRLVGSPLIDGEQPAGTYFLPINLEGLAAGVYTVRLTTESGVSAHKVVKR